MQRKLQKRNEELSFGESNFRSLPGAYLSCFGKKGTKEPTQGRMLEARNLSGRGENHTFYPGFEPPSPENPSRPLRAEETLSSRFCYPPASPVVVFFIRLLPWGKKYPPQER